MQFEIVVFDILYYYMYIYLCTIFFTSPLWFAVGPQFYQDGYFLFFLVSV